MPRKYFDIRVEVSQIISWKCPKCGQYHEYNDDNYDCRDGLHCSSCDAKFKYQEGKDNDRNGIHVLQPKKSKGGK